MANPTYGSVYVSIPISQFISPFPLAKYTEILHFNEVQLIDDTFQGLCL